MNNLTPKRETMSLEQATYDKIKKHFVAPQT